VPALGFVHATAVHLPTLISSVAISPLFHLSHRELAHTVQLGGAPSWVGPFRHEIARRGALKLLEEIRTIAKRQYVPAFHFVQVYVGLGGKDQAFAWLEKAYEARELAVLGLKANPRLDSLRSDSRCTNLLRRVGLP
jgi:hypothetical protein